jgi:hypothetical protein
MDGVSRITAWAIRENPDVTTHAGQHIKNKKWAGFVECIDARDIPRILISTEPIFDTDVEAKAAVDKVVAEIRAAGDSL